MQCINPESFNLVDVSFLCAISRPLSLKGMKQLQVFLTEEASIPPRRWAPRPSTPTPRNRRSGPKGSPRGSPDKEFEAAKAEESKRGAQRLANRSTERVKKVILTL